jgi:hypothetical protein
MMYKNIVPFFLIVLFCSCGKDKFTTRPQLKFEKMNTNLLRPGQVVQFNLSFSDLEGDLEDSIYVEKFEPRCVDSRFSEKYAMPAFPTSRNSQGEIVVSYGYLVDGFPLILGPQCARRNDTCVFRFMLKDKAQNRSDTVESDVLVISRD